MHSIHQIFHDHFNCAPTVVASAPGRVEVIGNHTDYNGGTVVGACVEKRLFVALRLRKDQQIRLFSQNEAELVETSVRSYTTETLPHWTSYALGVFDEFRMLGSHDFGFDLAINSAIPTGEGLSSSAAFEMATALAFNKILGLNLPMAALVLLSHRAENRYVGVPCGLLDQTVVGFGKTNSLIVLDASSGRHHVFQIAEAARLFIFRTHIRHELRHSPYEVRHRECRNALIALSKVIPGIRHLAHLHPSDIKAYDIIMDEVLVRRARHVIEEQRRVGAFLGALHAGNLSAAGQFLNASHHSSRSLFENSSPELDFLVSQLCAKESVFGARLSGAGWGGAAVALTSPAFTSVDAEQVVDAYETNFEARPGWWTTTIGPGAMIHEEDWIHGEDGVRTEEKVEKPSKVQSKNKTQKKAESQTKNGPEVE